MAENKKSFILYADQSGLFDKLPDVKAGKLIKLIFDYINDKNPSPTDILLQVAFEPIKLQLKRDLKIWEAERSKRSEAGKKGGIKSGESRRAGSKRSSASKNEANEADNVNVNVNDTVTARENTTPLIEYRIEECLSVAMKDERWVKANKATEHDLKEFNRLLERRGHYKKNPGDYKSHFANWKSGGKKESFFDKSESSAPPLTRYN